MYKLSRVLLLTLYVISSTLFVAAQDNLSDKLLPTDSKVHIGKLDNGFTYYIRENKKPEKRVEMQLVVNAGSILEDDDQLGLAHFIEHMAFNGTEHFEKNELKNYLESIGIRFGPELNAYTSYDETVYMLTIPSDSVNLLEKGFMVMEDWAHGLTLDETEIDKERGVIVEEWRQGQGYMQRMRDEFLPVVFKDSRYADRSPIGEKQIIENCSYETLRRFYGDWYRPDLMALIVVGDIDGSYAEEMIIEHFSKLTMPEIVRERKNYEVDDNEGTLTSIVTDKETPYNMILVLNKADALEQNTHADYLQSLYYSFITGILNRRLVELTELENPPFIGANYSFSGMGARTKKALQGSAIVGESGIENGLKSLLSEAERVDRFGYTQGEFDRYKLDLLRRYETAYNEKDKTESRSFASEYKRNFLDNEPIPGIEFEYEFVKDNIDRITITEINRLTQELIGEDNRIIVIGAPENPNIPIPSEEEILAIAESVAKTDIDAYADNVVATELMTEKPVPGSILEETTLDSLDALDIKLSNGVRVILKPTKYKNDEVLVSAYSIGGHSVYPDEDHFTAMNADGIVKESGVAEFSKSDISKILAGKSVYVAPSISMNSEVMSAQSKTSDLESMFQLMYLYFTSPRVDTSAFKSYVTKKKDLFENLYKEPQNYFYDKYYRIKAQNHPRGNYLPLSEDWDKIDFDRAIEIYRERFADPASFTFVIVGTFNTDTIKLLLEQYIASLPGTKREESFIDLDIRPPYEKTLKEVYKGKDPKSLALVYFEKEIAWNEYDAFMIGVLNDILRMKYIDILREEMSGVYTVRASAKLEKIPYEHAWLQITIPCAPENVDSLVYTAINEISDIQKNGVDDENITKAIETRRRTLETSKQNNKFWLNSIRRTLILGTDLDSITNEKLIEKISSDEIQRVANKYFDIDRYLQVVLYPEEIDANK